MDKDAATGGNVQVLERLTRRLAKLSRGEEQFPRWQFTTRGITRLLAKRTPEVALELFAARALMGVIELYDYLAMHRDLDPPQEDERFVRLLATSRRNFEESVAIVRGALAKEEAPSYVADWHDDVVRCLRIDVAISQS